MGCSDYFQQFLGLTYPGMLALTCDDGSVMLWHRVMRLLRRLVRVSACLLPPKAWRCDIHGQVHIASILCRAAKSPYQGTHTA